MATITPFKFWPVGLWVGLCLFIIMAFIRLPSQVAPLHPEKLPFFSMNTLNAGRTEDGVAERLAAYDPVPLFLPSSWSGWQTLPMAELTLNEVPPVPTPSAAFVYAPAELELKLLADKPLPEIKEFARQLKSSHAVWVLGREDEDSKALPARGGQLEVIAVEMGQQVVQQALILPVTAPSRVSENLWAPIEFSGLIDRTRWVGQLTVNRSSGADDVDEFFRTWLQQEIIPSLSFRSGFYLFRVGP